MDDTAMPEDLGALIAEVTTEAAAPAAAGTASSEATATEVAGEQHATQATSGNDTARGEAAQKEPPAAPAQTGEERPAASIFAQAKRKLKQAERREAELNEKIRAREAAVTQRETELQAAAENWGALFRKFDASPWEAIGAWLADRGVDQHSFATYVAENYIGKKTPPPAFTKPEPAKGSPDTSRLEKLELALELQRFQNKYERGLEEVLSTQAAQLKHVTAWPNRAELLAVASEEAVAHANAGGKIPTPAEILLDIEERLAYQAWKQQTPASPPVGEKKTEAPSVGGASTHAQSQQTATIAQTDAGERTAHKREFTDDEEMAEIVRLVNTGQL